ncbi:MAG: SDR family oxidoreductase [Deltaproteobacteria bacterium]|nr:SDR family oxidoreductase [Deltaproteobacteria bacterium]
MKSPIDGGTVLVTGASSGIGREVARQIAPRAKALILVARRQSLLDELAVELRAANPKLDLGVFAVDVTDRDELARMADEAESRFGGVDVLVNNAGVGDFGCFDLAAWEKMEFMLELNVRALLFLTHRFVRGMVARRRGAILNISSSYGLTFNPGFAGYIGTKYFVTGFSEALGLDLAGTGVTVTQSCPGPVESEFLDNVNNFTSLKPPGFVTISAARCARTAIRALDCRRAIVTRGWIVWALMRIAAWTPNVVMRIAYYPLGRMLRTAQTKAQAKRA